VAGPALLAVAMVLGLRAGIASPRGDPGATRGVDPEVITILPFHLAGTDPALPDLRDWLQDLLVARFTGEGSPRALAPAVLRAAMGRPTATDHGDIAVAAALQLAVPLGAGLLLYGTVAGTTDRLTLEATLVAVPDGVVRAEARVQGGADSLPYLADRLTLRLLAMVQATREGDDVKALTATTLPALRAYLAGRAAYRQGRAREAGSSFDRARFLDSTFTPAALGHALLHMVWGYGGGADEFWKIKALWRQRGRLNPADRALLVAYMGPRYPRPSTLVELIAAAEQAARLAPGRLEAQYIAGYQLFSYGEAAEVAGWHELAITALTHALVLDSTHTPAAWPLFEMAADNGDREGIRHYAALLLRFADSTHDSDYELRDYLRWRAAVVLGDSAALAAARSRFPRMYSGLGFIAMVGQSETGGVEDATRAAGLYIQHANGALDRSFGLHLMIPLMLNRGRPAAAYRLLTPEWSGSQFGGLLDFQIYAALFWDGDTTAAAAAAHRLQTYLDGRPLDTAQVRDQAAAGCALSLWLIARRDTAGAHRALGRARDAPWPGESFPPESGPVCVGAVQALLAAAQDAPAAARALRALDRLLHATTNTMDARYWIGNLVASRLHEAQGDLAGALKAVRRGGEWWNPFLSTQLREQGRLAALVGDRAGAIRAYRWYLALRTAPEPALRPEVDRVRAELLRLERGDLGEEKGVHRLP
jgi:hypothetical protein